MRGKVWLVGAGPGDRGLFTLKGLEVLQSAEVVVYDALIGDEVLTLIPEHAEKINVGKRAGNHRMAQEQINRVLLEQAQAGKRVVRLKGGDPFVFGRGGEELELLAEHAVPFEVVPGVTSAFAVPAYNGIPVTHRSCTSSVHIITGHRRAGESPDAPGIPYEALVRTGGTLIFLMGLSSLPAIMQGLLDAGMDPAMPAAVLERGTTAGQRRVVATVAALEQESARARIQAPAIIVVGEVCGMAETFAWAEKRPLGGRKILLTRPRDLSSEMAARLRRLGAEVLELPAIETVPVEPNPELEACMECFSGVTFSRETFSEGNCSGATFSRETFSEGNCSGATFSRRAFSGRTGTGAASGTEEEGTEAPGTFERTSAGEKKEQISADRPGFDWLVFTSPTGVRIFLDRFLEDRDIRALAGTRIAAIGAGSTGKLRQYGLRADFVPSVYDGVTLGRELAAKIRSERGQSRGAGNGPVPGADFCASSAPGENPPGPAGEAAAAAAAAAPEEPPVRILIPRAAAGGRELVEELEKAENVEILDISTYDTLYRSPGLIDLGDRLRRGEIDLAVFTSASTVRGFCAAVKADSDPADLSAVRAVCIGRQTRAAAEAAGMRTWMARQATLDALEDAVVECAAACQKG